MVKCTKWHIYTSSLLHTMVLSTAVTGTLLFWRVSRRFCKLLDHIRHQTAACLSVTSEILPKSVTQPPSVGDQLVTWTLGSTPPPHPDEHPSQQNRDHLRASRHWHAQTWMYSCRTPQSPRRPALLSHRHFPKSRPRRKFDSDSDIRVALMPPRLYKVWCGWERLGDVVYGLQSRQAKYADSGGHEMGRYLDTGLTGTLISCGIPGPGTGHCRGNRGVTSVMLTFV